MKIDLVIFSRDRDISLQKTIQRLSGTNLRVLVFHNSTQDLALTDAEGNVEYFFCPGMSLSERAKEAKYHLRSSFSVICSDDDGVVESELLEMMRFMELNPEYASIGGLALGAFPYGSLVTGSFAYPEMDSYENSSPEARARLVDHMLGRRTGRIPRAAMYRLFRKEKMEILLEALSQCDDIKTPYIFEVVSEFLAAWIGPTTYLPYVYWIRNWKNVPINHSTWDRDFEFSDWWESENFQQERSRLISYLVRLTKLDQEFILDLFSSYSRVRRLQTKPITKIKGGIFERLRRQKQLIVQILYPKRTPPRLESVIASKYPAMTEFRVTKICRVAEEMFAIYEN